jgi:uncharacterized protein (DUF433 family)
MLAELLKQKIGTGLYTVSDISQILDLPKAQVRRYISKYWDERFGRNFLNERYSWNEGNVKIVNFYVLIEFFTVFRLKELGVTPYQILKARDIMAKEVDVPYPFASFPILTNGKRIWYEFKDSIIKADGSRQMYFEKMLKSFCEKIDFNGNNIAERFWPKGKSNSIVVDPHHQFGQPVIFGTNISAEILYSMYVSGDSISMLSELYDLSRKQVKDAVSFYQHVA